MQGQVGIPSLVPVRFAPPECQSGGDIMGLDWTAQEEAKRHVTEVDAQLPLPLSKMGTWRIQVSLIPVGR